MLWEGNPVLGDKPRRKKNKPQVKRYLNKTGNWPLILAWKKEATKQVKCFQQLKEEGNQNV